MQLEKDECSMELEAGIRLILVLKSVSRSRGGASQDLMIRA